MEFVPATTLWVLSVIRLPAARDPQRGSVFRATILAAIACTLYIPAFYYGVDPLLGGHNRVGLATLLSLLLGFWQFRTAILLAAVADVDVRRRHHLWPVGCGFRLHCGDGWVSDEPRGCHGSKPAPDLR